MWTVAICVYALGVLLMLFVMHDSYESMRKHGGHSAAYTIAVGLAMAFFWPLLIVLVGLMAIIVVIFGGRARKEADEMAAEHVRSRTDV